VTLSGSIGIGFGQIASIDGIEAKGATALDGFNSNNFTISATEDLGGGLKATAYMMQRKDKSGADSTTGDFYVRLAGAFGTVQTGQYTWASYAGWNAFGSRSSSGLNGTAGAGVGGSNTFEYITPNISGLTVSIAMTAKPAANTSTAASLPFAKNGSGIKVNYVNGPLSLVAFRTSSATASTTDLEAAKVSSVGAMYDFGMAKVFWNAYSQSAGQSLTSANAIATRVDETGNSLSVQVPVGAATLKAGFINRGKNTGTAATSSATPGAFDKSSVGVDYALSKRTTLIADYATSKQAVAGTFKSTNYFVGVQHTF